MTAETTFAGDGGDLALITFDVAGESFALPMEAVREIAATPRITRVPGAAPYVRGMVNLRGAVLPVIDLALRFGLGACGQVPWLVVVADGDDLVALAAEGVGKVPRLARSALLPPPPTLNGSAVGFVEGVAKTGGRFVTLLRPERLLEDDGAP